VAIECDGDRLQSLDRLPAEMAKQAALERVGWRFRRIRASRFYRDRDGTMEAVCRDLRRMGLEPMRPDLESAVRIDDGENLEGKIIRRAWQIMRDEAWVVNAPGEPPPPPDAGGRVEGAIEELSSDALIPLGDGSVVELVMDETTEPHFVIIEQKDR
jgi:hypothetical protein